MFTELIRPLFIVAWLLINKESEDEKQSARCDFDSQKILNSLFEINSALFIISPETMQQAVWFQSETGNMITHSFTFEMILAVVRTLICWETNQLSDHGFDVFLCI